MCMCERSTGTPDHCSSTVAKSAVTCISDGTSPRPNGTMNNRKASGTISTRVAGQPSAASTSAGDERHGRELLDDQHAAAARDDPGQQRTAAPQQRRAAEGWKATARSSSRLRQASHRLIGRIRKPCEKAASPNHFCTSEAYVSEYAQPTAASAASSKADQVTVRFVVVKP